MSRRQRTPLRIEGVLHGQIRYIDYWSSRSEPARYTVPLQLSRSLTAHELRAMEYAGRPDVQADGHKLVILNTTEEAVSDTQAELAAFIADIERRGAELEATDNADRVSLAHAYQAERERLQRLTEALRAG